jgi:hypothetical protein
MVDDPFTSMPLGGFFQATEIHILFLSQFRLMFHSEGYQFQN